MKTLKTIFKAIRWIIAFLILVFSIATLMAKSYGQTVCLVLIAILLVYWPDMIQRNLKKSTNIAVRIFSIVILIAIKQVVFKSEPKSGIYRSNEHKNVIFSIYDSCMQSWPENTKDLYITSKYGKVHVLECGNSSNPPLVMFHAASMGAHSWAENLEPIIENYHIFSFDNPGEGNKSELDDVLVFPANPKEVADLYEALLDSLHVDSAVVYGASNGGFIAQNLAYYHPGKVSKLALFGPMGLTQLTKGSIAMMAISSMYPFQFLRNAVADWAIGTAPVCHEKYGLWFSSVMKGSIPSIARPVPVNSEQKKSINIPVLLFLGSKDKIVGDAKVAKKTAEDYPNIQIEVLDSGHLIAVEHFEKVNQIVSDFLSNNLRCK
ncbi:MAG: alpha/beta hydrolase [Bacteroidales bacterium]|nr:alpha/beta hydrolase [Bacteroidales bacterium]